MKKIYKGLSLLFILKMLTPADKLLFLFLFFFAFSGFFFVQKLMPEGNSVNVSFENKRAYRLPMNEDQTVAVAGPLGESIVELRDGKVRMNDSPCPNRLCVRQGWIKRGSIICLPNRIVISVGDGLRDTFEHRYDAVTR